MLEIELLHQEIRLCRACTEAGFSVEPPPLVSGHAPATFMLIGQAPSRSDQLNQHMYTGPAAQKLFVWLRSAGFTDDDFGGIFYLTALTKCFPGRLPGKSTDRAPSSREMALCSHWLTSQLAIVRPKAVLLFGKMAVDRFLGPGSMTDRIGQTFHQGGIEYIPLPHSSGASTWLNYPENRARLALALEIVRQVRLRVLAEAVSPTAPASG